MKEIDAASNAAQSVSLREVLEDDLETFFEHQLDPDALRMAAFPSRDRGAHMAHWHRILADDSVTAATVLFEGSVAGDIVSWDNEGEREVGYWMGRSFWGKGIATAALAHFLNDLDGPPLRAHVAKQNVGSLRVLEKCGFTIVGESKYGGVDELVLFLAD
ncbi:MAG TPA: GNAT family N-acetyltransferase [Actinomycetota bacterium]|nr:GNAT family N-acetyltransferase [Actinomycetota bacterium]